RIQESVREAVQVFVDAGANPDVEFSPEDATRTEPAFLREVVERAIDAGATTVNIPDTVGYATPDQMYQLITDLKTNVPNIDKATISVHCHNDLGLAAANSLAAVEAGAQQVECTVNGLGERAGMPSTEAIVMALKVRQDHYHTYTGVDTKKLVPTSKVVEQWSGIQRSPFQPVTGRNAFAHESGIHQDGVLKNPETYEIMKPEDVGCDGSELILGKHSGMRAVCDRFSQYDLPWRKEDRDAFRRRFKKLADSKAANKKYLSDDELLEEVYFPTVEDILATAGKNDPIIAGWTRVDPIDGLEAVEISTRDGKIFQGKAKNTEQGTINALVEGMKNILPGTDLVPGKAGYHEESIGSGSDAAARATVTLHNDHTVKHSAQHTRQDRAATDAVIGAFNRLYAVHEYQKMIAQPDSATPPSSTP
ncbi:MAG: alpha-isopropylmalate synthase regulatory domain-containing protein, partial [Candidatus Peribacteraceae bacterium]